MKVTSLEEFAVADLFCGVGGLSHGFLKEGFHVSAGLDFDATCKFAYENNNESIFLHKDIQKLTSEDFTQFYPAESRRILVGCAPCQPFSKYARKNASKVSDENADEKWKLLYSFSDVINQVNPEIISMENVPHLLKYNGGTVFNDFVKKLEEKNYTVSHKIVNACDYGVPQRRSRLILLASKHGKITLIKPTHTYRRYRTVRDAIGDLPPINDGEIYKNDTLHRARKLTEINKKRIKATPAAGGWKDWSEDLISNCHKTAVGKDFTSAYGRMNWDEPAPTLTTHCTGLSNGRFGHPDQDRAISLKEAALIQSFPRSYRFIEKGKPVHTGIIARHIGNAVPVLLARAIAKSIRNHIESIQ